MLPNAAEWIWHAARRWRGGDTVTVRGEAEQAKQAARARAVAAVASRLGLRDPVAAQALGEAHDVVWDHLAPFVVAAANDMLRDVQAEIQANPARRIVFLGRDGHSLAIAARALDPQLYDRHCSEVVLSRVIVEGALQDLERNSGKSFPGISDFRKVSAKVNEDAIAGARLRLGDYLQRNRIPAGQPGSEITLIDTSFKGTIQECLSAIFPQTAFRGRYVFFGASPHDLHADTKRGYVLHLGAAHSNGGRPLAELPDDPELTFACQDAVAAVEETLSGPLSTPEHWGEGGPAQQASDGSVPDGLNPLRVAHLYTDPGVRQAVKHINLLAVKQYADFTAQGLHRGELRVDAAMEQARELGSQLRAWICEADPDPRLARMLDSFVRRSDKDEASRLSQRSGLWVSKVRISDASGRCTDANQLSTTSARSWRASRNRGTNRASNQRAPGQRPRTLGRLVGGGPRERANARVEGHLCVEGTAGTLIVDTRGDERRFR